jgi:hypothetical protein
MSDNKKAKPDPAAPLDVALAAERITLLKPPDRTGSERFQT